MDYEVQRCSRTCTITGRELAPGETVYSVLASEGGALARRDYSVEAWQGPPDGIVAWWKSQLPAAEAKKGQWAPNDVMLELFEQLEDRPDQQDMRYVLGLLLVRRRVLRLEDTVEDEELGEVQVLYSPKREAEYRVPATMPTDERAQEIQDELARLLTADAP